MKVVFAGLIRLYQVALSPLMGCCCRFDPSCSEYMKQSINKYGCVIGFWRGLTRVLRCHPFHSGGYDPVL